MKNIELPCRVYIIDHEDSFTYTLKSYFEVLGATVYVVSYHALNIQKMAAWQPTHLVLSPGPGHPEEAEKTIALIQAYYKKIPILGVCLGHQCIAKAFGGEIIQASEIYHGKTSQLIHQSTGLFHNHPKHFKVTRYHSWVIDNQTMPKCLYTDAHAYEDGAIMSIHHTEYPIFGLQYHPEAILTENGFLTLMNYLTSCLP